MSKQDLKTIWQCMIKPVLKGFAAVTTALWRTLSSVIWLGVGIQLLNQYITEPFPVSPGFVLMLTAGLFAYNLFNTLRRMKYA